MSSAPSVAPPASFRRILLLGPLLVIIALAAGARAWLQFRTPLAPGINGAYYFVHARAVLEHGLPGVPDLPLTFWLHAGLARIIETVAGLPRDDAIVLTVKLADSLLPPLVALPLAWLGWRWQRRSAQPSALAALAPAALVCLGAPALSMTGDFQKNSLALVWLAAFAPAAHAFLRHPGWRTALAPLLGLALLGLTHVGVLGVALGFAAVLAVMATLTAAPAFRRRILLFALIGAGVLVAAGTVIYLTYDPARITRLVRAVADPSTANEDKRRPGLRAGSSPRPEAGQHDPAFSPPRDGPKPAMRPGPMGGPPGPGMMKPIRRLPGLLFIGVGAAGLALAWRRRRELPAADLSVGVAAAVTAVAFGGPFYDEQLAERLRLIAVVPGAMTLSLLLAGIERTWLRRTAGTAALAATVLSAVLYLPRAGQPTISLETAAELRSLAPLVQPANRTLIVARHGLEWWTAWTLHTHIAQPQAVITKDWSRFDRVCYLTEKRADHPGGPNFGPAGRPPSPPDGEDPRGGPPPDFDLPGGARPMRPPGPGGGPMELQAPEDATTLHDGDNLKLSWVVTAPQITEPGASR